MKLLPCHLQNEDQEMVFKKKDKHSLPNWNCSNGNNHDGNKNKSLAELPNEPISLPAGAEGLVRNIVAQRILELMLQEHIDKFSSGGGCIGLSQRQVKSILDLVAQFPVICQRKYQFERPSDGRIEEVYPLFVLLQLQPTLDLVEKVFEAYPGAMFDTSSYRPIDIACEMNAPLEVVKFLHFQNPDAVKTPVKDGRYPLHVALSFYNHHYEDSHKCHNQHGQSQQEHRQGPSQDSADVVNFLLDIFPDAARVQDSRGHFPIHHAAFSGAPVSILQRLLSLCEDSVSATDHKMWTPLHCACRYGARGRYNYKKNCTNSSSTNSKNRNHQPEEDNDDRNNNLANIQYLVGKAPLSLHVQNQGGWTPVMTAVGYQSKDVITYLFEQIPEDYWTQNIIRSMLRLAAKHNTADSVEFIASRYPWMLSSQVQSSGGTPLHYAAKRPIEEDENAVEVCRVLIHHNRQALTMTDHQGRLPLNCAYHVSPNSATTQLLLEETARGA